MLKFATTLAFLAAAAPAFAGEITVTSPAGLFTNPGPTNASGPGQAFNSWYANNVRSGGAAGITTARPDAGNGSIQFELPAVGNAKADFEYYFSTSFALSQLTALSYDAYRSSSSTAAVRYDPALRLYVSDGSHTGYLVFEPIYNGQSVAPVDTFSAFNVINSYFWSTGSLPDAASVYNRTLTDWVNLLPNLRVYGLSTGVGSGWDGTFSGAVDRVSYGVNGADPTTFNFEVAPATPVPEPASVLAAAAGLLGLGAVRRRRG